MGFLCTLGFLAFIVILVCIMGRLDQSTGRTALRVLESGIDLAISPEGATSIVTTPQTQRVKRYVPPFMKKQVAARQLWKCQMCQRTLDATYEIDHIKPLFRGGDNSQNTTCRRCAWHAIGGRVPRKHICSSVPSDILVNCSDNPLI